jgi:hypothetical protein
VCVWVCVPVCIRTYILHTGGLIYRAGRESCSSHIGTYMYMHKYIRTYTLTYTGCLIYRAGREGCSSYIRTYMYIHTYINTYVHTQTCTGCLIYRAGMEGGSSYIHIHICMYIHTYLLTYIYVHTYTGCLIYRAGMEGCSSSHYNGSATVTRCISVTYKRKCALIKHNLKYSIIQVCRCSADDGYEIYFRNM